MIEESIKSLVKDIAYHTNKINVEGFSNTKIKIVIKEVCATILQKLKEEKAHD